MSADSLGELFNRELQEPGTIDISLSYLEELGIGVNTVEFADWLTKYKLRKLPHAGRHCARFTLQT